MIESGCKLLRDILFNDSEHLPAYSSKARMKAAEGLGRVESEDAIYYLREYIISGDCDNDVLAEAIDAYAWALETHNNRDRHEQNRAAAVSR